MIKTTIAAFSLIALGSASSFCIAEEFARFTDSTEHAFSVDVPRGWAVTGGIARRSVMQPHVTLTLRSPGGLTFMALGNLHAYTYTLP
jgi:NAD(P)H-hydrate repair Nnr-like enzyme with NAD(P)H-hydrate epimerase domain